MLKVYGLGFSLFVRKVRTVLEFKGVEYEHDGVMPGVNEHSPIGKVPYLIHGDFSVSDSSVIVQYIEKLHPENPVFPSDPREYAKALWFEEYSDTRATEILSALFFEQVGKPKLFKQEPDQDRVNSLLERVPEVFDYLESVLKTDYLVGNTLTIADISLSGNLANYLALDYSIDANRWPKLANYTSRVLQSPAIKNVLDKEKAEMAALS